MSAAMLQTLTLESQARFPAHHTPSLHTDCSLKAAGRDEELFWMLVLVLAGIELIFFLVAGTACFGFSVRMLITH